MLLNKIDGRGPALTDLISLLLIDMGRKDNLFRLAIGCHWIEIAVLGWQIIFGDKLAGDMAAADTHHVKDRRVTGF